MHLHSVSFRLPKRSWHWVCMFLPTQRLAQQVRNVWQLWLLRAQVCVKSCSPVSCKPPPLKTFSNYCSTTVILVSLPMGCLPCSVSTWRRWALTKRVGQRRTALTAAEAQWVWAFAVAAWFEAVTRTFGRQTANAGVIYASLRWMVVSTARTAATKNLFMKYLTWLSYMIKTFINWSPDVISQLSVGAWKNYVLINRSTLLTEEN